VTFREPARKGLCTHCRWARSIRNRRGSEFLLCRKSAEVPDFPKYPRLPVLECDGFEASAPDALSPEEHA